MKHSLILLSLALGSLVACKQQVELPKTPEEVIKAYQAFYDQNLFEEAKGLCTASEQKRLDELSKMMDEQSPDSTLLSTTFLSVNCSIKGDSAICKCRCKDQYETYKVEFVLLRRNKKWLIDAPREEQYDYEFPDEGNEVDTLFNLLDVEQQKQ